MKKQTAPFFMYPNWMRYIGIALIVLGLIVFIHRIVAYDIVDLSGGSFPLGMGLIMIFFAREKAFDERIAYLKFKALSVAVPIAAIIVMIVNYLHNFEGYSIETDSWYSISAFEYLTIAFVLALGLLYYFKEKE